MQKIKKMNKILLCLIFLSSFVTIRAQESFDEKSIIENNANYFKLERENIHVQFDKTVYPTTEIIWFKGYVIDKVSSLPNIKSSNIIMELYNSKKEKIDSKLLYSENSTFFGHYKTEKITESGKYYFRFFTNHMNNFSEDESSTYEITIINPSNYVSNLLPKFDINKVNIDYFPESGILLEDTDNSIIVDIKDCNGLGGVIENIQVQNNQNKTITSFSTNKEGIGKFNLLNTKDSNYKIKIQKNNSVISEKTIRKPTKEGYIISINDNYNSGTLFIEIKSNSSTLTKKEKIWFGIQHLGNIELIKINFDEGNSSKRLAFLKKDLNYGINNFVITNEKKEILSERLYYNHNSNSNNNIEIINKRITKDSIKYTFKSNFKLGEVSYSILPSKSISKPEKNSIYSSLKINNCLNKELNNISYYLNDYNRLRHFELDNALQTVKYKYNFINNMNFPVEKFEAENGLTLNGKINTQIDNKDHKIQLLSILTGKSILSDINEKNEFSFKNLIVDDSTSVHLTMYNKNGKTKEFSAVYNLVKPKSTFFKPINIKSYCPENILKKEDLNAINLPILNKNIHLLDSIHINKTEVRKQKLVNNRKSPYLNGFSDGYKINSDIIKSYNDVITFLRSKGYDINTSGTDVSIRSRTNLSFRNDNQPTIMMNNSPIIDLSILYGMSLEEVDEIYINKRGYGTGSNGASGVIHIFTKKSFMGKGSQKSVSKNFICDSGFTPSLSFKNTIPVNFTNKSFIDFGTFFWNPKTNTNENGAFEVTLPRVTDENITLIIEGIDSSGLLLSKSIEIKP